MPAERLQKILARAGHGSRRACEGLIAAGQVAVDGRVVTELGTKADPGTQRITCGGRPVRLPRSVYFAFYKPRGVLSTLAHHPRERTLHEWIERLPVRVVAVGRLDRDSEGLLILTNDGAFANRLAHPRYGAARRYHVLIAGRIPGEVAAKIRKGIWLSEGRTGPVELRVKHEARDLTVAEVVIREGKNREVRRVFARFGLKVRRLVRLAFGPVQLGTMKPGEMRMLSARERLDVAAAGRRS